MSKKRSIKVYGQSGYKYRETPTIMLKGKWLKEAGFDVGDYISVTCEDGKIVIAQDAERAAVKAAEAAFMDREMHELLKKFQVTFGTAITFGRDRLICFFNTVFICPGQIAKGQSSIAFLVKRVIERAVLTLVAFRAADSMPFAVTDLAALVAILSLEFLRKRTEIRIVLLLGSGNENDGTHTVTDSPLTDILQ